jgi:hypothetical protein
VGVAISAKFTRADELCKAAADEDVVRPLDWGVGGRRWEEEGGGGDDVGVGGEESARKGASAGRKRMGRIEPGLRSGLMRICCRPDRKR